MRPGSGRFLCSLEDYSEPTPTLPTLHVWSAAALQAKNESDVYGLCWRSDLLAWMECAAPSSYLVTRPWKAVEGYRFQERRDRPLCHLMVRQQTWQDFENSDLSAVGAGVQMWESRMRFPSLALLPGLICRPAIHTSAVSSKSGGR
jgi:hypothetical protein